MGRKKKYINGSSIITINIDNDVLNQIDNKAKGVNKNRSEFITDILNSFAISEKDYCSMMARKAAQELYYWKSRSDSFGV